MLDNSACFWFESHVNVVRGEVFIVAQIRQKLRLSRIINPVPLSKKIIFLSLFLQLVPFCFWQIHLPYYDVHLYLSQSMVIIKLICIKLLAERTWFPQHLCIAYTLCLRAILFLTKSKHLPYSTHGAENAKIPTLLTSPAANI